jgi:penicillin-binding protein 1A
MLSPIQGIRSGNYPGIISSATVYSKHLSTERAESILETPAERPAWSVWRWLGWLILAAILLVSAIAAGSLVGLAISFRNLPDVRALKNFTPNEPTQIADINGETLAVIRGESNRKVVALRDISPNVRKAILGIEDDRFYQHPGIRFDTLVRAAVTNFQEGRTVQGGSTITQQLIKNLFLTPERSFDRKVAEAVLSLRLEQVFTKDAIFEMYLNQVYWGQSAYGIETAAQTYFGKPSKKLDLAEGAMLAGMLRAPGYSPIRNPQKTTARQRVVLDRLRELGWVTQAEYTKARNEKLKFTGKDTTLIVTKAPYFSTYVVQELIKKYGRESVLKGGLRVQTTLDLKMQNIAEQTVTTAMNELRGRNASQMALVAMDPRTGYIKAMVGGVDFKKSQFNRASQARRQPGSTFKPFVYYTAFASGKYTPDTTIDDEPVTIHGYSPKNYDLGYSGTITLRQALVQSRNIPVVKIANKLGMEQVILSARRAGITSDLDPVLATAIGAGAVSPLELARGYSAFANGGFRVAPTAILQVTDQQGNILEQNLPQRERTLKVDAVRMLNSLLKAVVSGGTGTRAQLNDGRPVAGKTGTTSDFRDAWFAGFVPQLVTVIWVGNDDFRKPLERSTAGGTYVAPVWKRFMDRALEGQPILPFPGDNAPPIKAPATSTTAGTGDTATSEEVQPRRRRRRRRAVAKEETQTNDVILKPAAEPQRIETPLPAEEPSAPASPAPEDAPPN